MIKNSSHTDYVFFFLKSASKSVQKTAESGSYDTACPGGCLRFNCLIFFFSLILTASPPCLLSHLWINKDADGLLSRFHLPVLSTDSFLTSHPDVIFTGKSPGLGERKWAKKLNPLCLSETCLKSDVSPLSQLGHEAFLISVPNTKYLATVQQEAQEGGGEAQGSVLEAEPHNGRDWIEKIQALHKYFTSGETKSQWNLSCLWYERWTIFLKLLPCWHLNGVYILFMELNPKPFEFFLGSSLCNSSSWEFLNGCGAVTPFILFIKRNSKAEKMK